MFFAHLSARDLGRTLRWRMTESPWVNRPYRHIWVRLFVDWRELLGPSVAVSDSDEHHSNNENHREWRYVDRTPQHPESCTHGHGYANNEHDSAS